MDRQAVIVGAADYADIVFGQFTGCPAFDCQFGIEAAGNFDIFIVARKRQRLVDFGVDQVQRVAHVADGGNRAVVFIHGVCRGFDAAIGVDGSAAAQGFHGIGQLADIGGIVGFLTVCDIAQYGRHGRLRILGVQRGDADVFAGIFLAV